MPSKFGGDCKCLGGCELSDAGPWQDPQWLGPQTESTKATTGGEVKSEATESIGGAVPEAPSSVGGETMHAA